MAYDRLMVFTGNASGAGSWSGRRVLRHS